MTSLPQRAAEESCGSVDANVSPGFLSLTDNRSPKHIDKFFSGREEELRRVCDAIGAVLLDENLGSKHAHVAVLGAPGTGKSLLESQALLRAHKALASRVNESVHHEAERTRRVQC